MPTIAELWAFLPWGYFFTICLETPVLVLGLSAAHSTGRRFLAGLWLTGNTINIYSQIGLVMLVGLAAKNGILIVEFANQLRDQGMEFMEALIMACEVRLRPIIMTTLTTAAGTLPLILASGPGAETRQVIGIVVFSGVTAAAALTLFVVPVAYRLIARGAGSPRANSRRLDAQLESQPVSAG